MADPIETNLWFSEQKPGVSSTPRDSRGSYRLAEGAVVVGAGIGRFSAAGALAKYFDGVDILERDDLANADLRLGNWRKLPTCVNAE